MEEVLAHFKAVASLLATIPKEMGAAVDTASEAQKAVVVRLLNRMSFNTVEAGQVIMAAQAVPWTQPQHLEAIVTAVTTRVQVPVAAALVPFEGSKRHKGLQDFESFPVYPPDRVWQSMTNQPATAMDTMVDFLVQLGLCHPTEKTIQKITAAIMLASEGRAKLGAMQPTTLHEVLKTVKRLLRCKASKAEPLLYMEVLPISPATFGQMAPGMYDAVYQMGGPGQCPFGETELHTVSSAIPMRSSRMNVTSLGGQSAFSLPASVCQFAQTMAQQVSALQEEHRHMISLLMGGARGEGLQLQLPAQIALRASAGHGPLALMPPLEGGGEHLALGSLAPPSPGALAFRRTSLDLQRLMNQAEQDERTQAEHNGPEPRTPCGGAEGQSPAEAPPAAQADGAGQTQKRTPPAAQADGAGKTQNKTSVDDAVDGILDAIQKKKKKKAEEKKEAKAEAKRKKAEEDAANPELAQQRGKAKRKKPQRDQAQQRREPKEKEPRTKAEVERQASLKRKPPMGGPKGKKPKCDVAAPALATAPSKPPSYCTEWSRKQVQCRSGLKGEGQNIAFKFSGNKDKTHKKALEQAEKWIKKKSEERGLGTDA